MATFGACLKEHTLRGPKWSDIPPAELPALFALPVSCGGFVLYNEHLHGDVQSGGPQAVLRAMCVAASVGAGVFALVWLKTRPR